MRQGGISTGVISATINRGYFDATGRRRTLGMACAMTALFGLCSALAPTYWWYLALRCMAGSTCIHHYSQCLLCSGSPSLSGTHTPLIDLVLLILRQARGWPASPRRRSCWQWSLWGRRGGALRCWAAATAARPARVCCPCWRTCCRDGARSPSSRLRWSPWCCVLWCPLCRNHRGGCS